jgi:acetyl-CoA acetyltransferase family protein
MEKVVILGGCRTPFAKFHTHFGELSAVDLGAMAVGELLRRVAVPVEQIDELIWGNVCPPAGVFNIARDIALRALSPKITGVSVSQACISSARAVTTAVDIAASSPEKIIVAGGSESLSNMPVFFPKRLVKRLYKMTFAKSTFTKTAAALNWHPSDYIPKTIEYSEPSTGLTMGQYGERLAKLLEIPREEQDRWALRSHQKAAAAPHAADIIPVETGGKKKTIVTTDNGIIHDTSAEKLASLPPAFDPAGTLTAGNSSKPADGACALMLTSERNARRLGLEPACYIRAYTYAALQPDDTMLLAPALAIRALCLQEGISLKDVDVIEMHEAFAAQLLATFKVINSKEFFDRHNQLFTGPLEIDEDRVNAWGGTLAFGHPFGATGGRLVLQCARRLTDAGGGLGLVSSCGAGGQGVAMLLEGVTR